MKHLKFSGLILLLITLLSACSSIPDQPWSDAVPQKTPFVIMPAEGATLNSVLASSYTPFLDDITSSANQLLSRIDSTAAQSIPLQAILLYTGTSNQLETVWMAKTSPNVLNKLTDHFHERFSQNEYYFQGVTIHKLNLQERILFAAQMHEHLLISESSLGIEDAIRAYLGNIPRADLSGLSLSPGNIIMNTPSLDQWIKQLTSVTYRPQIKNALKGTKPSILSVNNQNDGTKEVDFSGAIPLSENMPTDLVASFSSVNAPISLDRYISTNAAAFGLFRLTPRIVPPSSITNPTKTDSVLLADQYRYTDLAQTLNPEFALVTYAQSGFLSTGEHLFIRRVSDSKKLRNQLQKLAADNLIQRRDNTFFVQSSTIAKLIGSNLCSFSDFYLDVTGNAVVISKRKGLVEMVSSDRNRRRTMYYEQQFRDIKDELPKEISGLFVAGQDFYPFIEPFLAPDNYVDAMTSKFDLLTASTTLDKNNRKLSFNVKTYQTEDRSAPYREKWIFPTGAELSGNPIMADIGGSSQEEIIFATKSGNLYALAADGTVVMQANTDSDEPLGSPVVYDWYSTNQNVILIAAGDKVYGWNDNGQPLPKFPFKLSEPITSPLQVEDIDRNGLPNAVVATADRKLHALNGRGKNLSGWPVTANAKIHSKPIVKEYRGTLSTLAFSENAIHVWTADGNQRSGFPKFINASLNGSPLIHKNHILANAADGYLYAVGPNKLFADSLNVLETNSESSDIEAVYASNGALVGTPSVHNLTVNTQNQKYRENMILTMSKNGSVFLLNTNGQLRFTQNMGQPAAPSFSPSVTDLNNDNLDEIIALANFGRLYVWETYSGERIYSVPTSAMSNPIITDIDGDGYKELIAQTREGLRCWTIFGKEQ
ncbi:FG-GAP repeat domain-containing protein [Fodinibius saliphilus]|uniref:FG-GAP repeat domain-containing protein n=1 Tax=Fodinibius saliphilus TaxID=1920650 RepID=UPI0011082D13|nr:VCBS repeat-containing protein [Fodinibius saliphilus]